MTLPKWATTVTPLSKTLALIIFITFPIIGFFSGMKYEQLFVSNNNNQISPQSITNILGPTEILTSISPIVNPSTDNLKITGWKTYVSKRFSFKFEYPSELVLDNQYENTYPDQGFINIYSQEGYKAIILKEPRGGGSFIELGAYDNTQKLSLLDWAKKDTSHSNFNGQEYSNINIGGEKAIMYKWEGMGSGYQAILEKDSFIYVFSDFGYDDYLKQIVLTVEFTK